MKMSKRFAMFGIPLCMSAVLMVAGCGDKKGGKDADDSAADGGVVLKSSGPAGKFKEAMMEMVTRIGEITESVESVEDAQKAEPKIAAMMNDLAVKIEGITASITTPTEQDKKEFEMLGNDSELSALLKKGAAQRDELQAKHPEAVQKLDELTQKNSGRLELAIADLTRKFPPPPGSPMAPPPPASYDTGAPVPPPSASDTAK